MKIYDFLWHLGTLSGCHQLPERSLFIHNKIQFPICARCTGAWLGYICGIALYPFINIKMWTALILCGIMFIDWFLQYEEITTSNNRRRLLTGLLGGFGYINIILMAGNEFIGIFS